MALFGKKQEAPSTGLLGVDIGTSGIKIVELMPEGGKIRLVTYGYADVAPDRDASVLSLDDAKHVADIIRQIVKTSGMKSAKAVAALPASQVFHAIIRIPTPKTAKEDIRPAVEAQAAKLLPLPIAEMIIDSHIIDKDQLPKDEVSGAKKGEQKGEEPKSEEQAAKTVRVQVTAAPKALVEKYIAIFRAAKIELTSLETEVFALMRSLIGKDNAKTMIVDVGGDRTNIVIAERGVPYLTRGIKSGGSAVTSAFSTTMSIGIPEAEAMKKDLSLAEGDAMPPVLASAIKPLLHEARYALDVNMQEETVPHPVNKVILTGGSASLVGLDAAMTNALNVNVYIGDPWARIATPPASRAILDEVGSRFAVAIGLAMRVIPEKEK